MSATDTWKSYSTEAVFNGIAVPVDTFYAGLGSSSFSVGVDDTTIGEITGSGYARVPVQWSDFVTDMSNTNTIVFAVSASWPPVEYVFIANASQGGRVLLYADAGVAKTVVAGDTISISIGDLILT